MSRNPISIPAWRQNAQPGQTLAQAMGNGSAGGTGLRSDASPRPAPSSTLAAEPKVQKDILRIIRPNARDRWMASTLAYYTPTVIENTARSAMSGNLVAQWMMFDLMEQTWPRLNKNLNEIKDGAKALPRIVQPYADKDEKPTPEAVRRAKIVDKVLRTMRPNVKKLERDLDETIYDCLDAMGKGIALSEILWEQRPVKIGAATSNLWCPRATRWVHPRYYGYPPGTAADEELMLNAVEVGMNNPDFASAPRAGTTPGAMWVPIPEDQFIVSIIQQKSGHPINSSLLRILGFWWAASNFTWEWFLQFAQIFGAPIRWATYDPASATAGTISELLDMLDQMGSFGRAAFPAGTNLQLLEAVKGGGTENPQKALLDAADLICDLMIIGQTLTSQAGRGGGGEGGGNRALGQVHQDIRSERIQKAANTAARTLTEQFIRAICRLNFGDDSECPQLLIVTKANKDLIAQAQRYQILLQIPGVQVSKQQFYEDNELTLPDENDDVIEGGPAGPATGMDLPGEPTDNPTEEDGEDTTSNSTAQARHCGCRGAAVARARGGDATDKVVDHALEELTGVEAKWLGGVKPFFQALLAKAKDSELSDADFIAALEKAKKQIPELFHKLDHSALATALEHAMGAAVVNGAVKGYVQRGSGVKTKNIEHRTPAATVREHGGSNIQHRMGGTR